MAIFYVGHRPVTRGRNINDQVHPITGQKAVYSNYSLFNTSNILAGAPNTDHVPGTGRHPHGVQLTNLFKSNSLHITMPLRNAGDGPELTWFRNFTDLYALKGQDGQDTFKASYGHVDRVTSYSLRSPFPFHGVGTQIFTDVGHVARAPGTEGAANDFGTRNPNDYGSKGVTPTPFDDPGQLLPVGYQHPYGKNKINEYKGLASAKAL